MTLNSITNRQSSLPISKKQQQIQKIIQEKNKTQENKSDEEQSKAKGQKKKLWRKLMRV